jgi:hypothetical protein
VASGERFTYKISESAKRAGDNRPPVFFVSVLTGPDNSDNFSFVGTIFERKTFKFSPKAGYRVDSPSVKAFSWAFSNFVGNIVPDKLEFWPSSHCARCGRKLTVPTSVHNGFGPECITKVGAAAGQAPIVGSQQPIPADLSNYTAMDNMVQASGRAVRCPISMHGGAHEVGSNEPSDTDVNRMINALRNFAPENFSMDGEMEESQARKFWFRRYKKQPLTPAELAEMEAR